MVYVVFALSVLNPDVSLQRLTRHIDKYMTKSRLLRYISYTEDLIKHKL